jgi:radical SAM protein with 4Fe4S-binding SPASM domain
MLQVVRQIPALFGVGTQVALLGGEPLLVPWSLDLAAEILRLDMKVTIFTNGILLSNDTLAQRVASLIKQGVKVRVSLAGPTTETSDTISGGSRFSATLLGIHKLSELGCRVKVDLMFVPQHVDVIADQMYELRKALPPGTPVSFGVLYLSGRETGNNLFESRRELDAALDRVAFEAGVSIRASATAPVAFRREGCVCTLGKHIHVRSDGTLFTCFKMEEPIGHLDNGGFAVAVRSIQENPRRATDLPACADCPLATLCGGGCRSENLLYTGHPEQPTCGPWRVRVISELLAEDRAYAVTWSVSFLLQEARDRGIDTPEDLAPRYTSRHLVEV